MLQIIDSVEVGTDQAGWKFPENHPTRTNDKGETFFVIPIEYAVFEPGEIKLTEEQYDRLCNAQDLTGDRAKNEAAILKAINAGIKLAQGNAAKAPYKVEGGKKALMAALQWASIETLTEYKLKQATDGTDAANDWLIDQYRDS